MGFNNPGVPWSEVERRLSDRWDDVDPLAARARRGSHPGDGGDSPAWSYHRESYEAPPELAERAGERRGGASRSTVPYAELHCHSSFSFLDGASSPESLAEEATRLGLDALAITDHAGFYGVVRFAEAARELALPTVFGAELTLNAVQARSGPADPDGAHLLVLARDTTGYARLAALLSEAQMAGEKGRPQLSFAAVAEAASGRARGHWAVLTGCRKGTVPAALVDRGPSAAERELRALVAAFGAEHTYVELWDHGDPLDSARNDALARLSAKVGVPALATNNVHHATPADRQLATAMAAIRARRSLDEIDGWLPGAGAAHLRSGAEQARRFARYPGVVAAAAELGRDCAFDLSLVAPNLPPYPCPPGPDGVPMTEARFLRQLVEEGGTRRYGPRHAERVPGAWAQIDHELDMIVALDFPGYFLIVWDIVEFCRRSDIYCQGRGSAANSAACYALGVTKADAVRLGLLFERFLSPERDGPPDIDLDIESGRREEVIQYVYERYGRTHAAQVANVITYRARSAVRDAARALGHDPGQQDAWSKSLDRWSGVPEPGADQSTAAGQVAIPEPVLALAHQLEDLPRHLGIHSGGMVMCDRPVIEVCPTEWARMEGRSVLQWDKDDCAAAGLVKFDLLGLGMLTALHLAVDLVREHHGIEIDLAELPQEDTVYDMLCAADSVGVFQVESRAQMATLPRLRPRCFYDLVVEVALIRPGPIQGGSVHPYIRRRKGEEPVTYLHPLLENSLAKTLGVPLFQEQLMQIAIDVAGFSPAEADQLRQAMGSKRSDRRMAALRARFDAGLAERDITGSVAEAIWNKLAAFANYGFPESHSVSFAYLVYASSWLKLHHPAAFCAALLNAQPMGFYSPQSLTQDARRHGVQIRTPDLNASDWCATLEPSSPASTPPTARSVPRNGADQLRSGEQNARGQNGVGERAEPATWGVGGPAVRLGIGAVRTIGEDLAKEIAAGRPYDSVEDLVRRCSLRRPQIEALATSGAFACFDLSRSGEQNGGDRGHDRRRAIWTAGAAAQIRDGQLPGMVVGLDAPQLPGMDDWETAVADLWATGVAPDGHPTRFLRTDLDRRGAVTATELRSLVDGAKVLVAGVVTHRQRPATAAGVTFVNLEDETGLINVVVSRGCWQRYRHVAGSAPALLVSGRLERSVDGVINVVATKLELLPVVATVAARNFR
jgi:error-prone DNA polymerase